MVNEGNNGKGVESLEPEHGFGEETGREYDARQPGWLGISDQQADVCYMQSGRTCMMQ